MTTEKWVRCTEQLAENPHKVKAWRLNIDQREVRFIAYDKGHEMSLIFRGNVSFFYAKLDVVECLIEVPIQEEYLTFSDGKGGIRLICNTLEEAQEYKNTNCTHILKLTYDGEKFQVEPVWTKEST